MRKKYDRKKDYETFQNMHKPLKKQQKLLKPGRKRGRKEKKTIPEFRKKISVSHYKN